MRQVPQQLQEMTQGVVDTLGYQLWGIEMLARQDGGQLLRVYIDAEKGIDVDDCAKVSRQLSACFDVEDPVPGRYTLEVSSPGMDRLIFQPAQFAAYVGSMLRVKLLSSITGRKNYRGKLLLAAEGKIQLQVDGKAIDLSFNDIDTARVVPEF
jgi:ribosome maturation factor RimP